MHLDPILDLLIWVQFKLILLHMAPDNHQLGVGAQDIFEGRKLIGILLDVLVAGIDQLGLEVEKLVRLLVRLIPHKNLPHVRLNVGEHLLVVFFEGIRLQIKHIVILLPW